MSVHFISGKPGGGKSLYGMRMLIDELRNGDRLIVTNLPVKLEALANYLKTEGFEIGCPLKDRLRLMDEDESYRFWECRERSCLVEYKKNAKGDEVPTFVNTKTGVLYIIDEVHIYYNARAWAKTGNTVLFYLSQHRKLGDDVLLITQHINNVDKQMRSVAQDYTCLRNLSKEKMGLFTMPNMFIKRVYGEPPSATAACMEMGSFRLDVTGIASCYDTAKGVGIMGRSADVGRKRKGVHWAVLVLGVPLLIIMIWKAVPSAVASLMSRQGPSKVAKAGTNAPQSSHVGTPVDSRPLPVPGPVLPAAITNQLEPDVCMSGYVFLQGRFRVFLSNGDIASNKPMGNEVRLQYLSDRYCIVEGRTNRVCSMVSYADKKTPPGREKFLGHSQF